jgi:hypothetical protein
MGPHAATERFSATLQIFDSILKWLAGLIQLTEEEQKDAGIYVDDQDQMVYLVR